MELCEHQRLQLQPHPCINPHYTHAACHVVESSCCLTSLPNYLYHNSQVHTWQPIGHGKDIYYQYIISNWPFLTISSLKTKPHSYTVARRATRGVRYGTTEKDVHSETYKGRYVLNGISNAAPVVSTSARPLLNRLQTSAHAPNRHYRMVL